MEWEGGRGGRKSLKTCIAVTEYDDPRARAPPQALRIYTGLLQVHLHWMLLHKHFSGWVREEQLVLNNRGDS